MKQLQFLLFTLFLFLQDPAFSQVIQASHTTVPLTSAGFFKTDEVIEMTLLSDFKTIRSQKKKGIYQDAVATLHLSERDSVTEAVRIAARGEMRRQVCVMPSLMVNFRTPGTSALAGLKKLKMVCGCSSTSYHERLLFLEYLTYKIYNFLTDMSFKVRLVKVNYRDVNNKVKPFSQYAFFIEDVDEMAKRNNCREYQKVTNSLTTNRNVMTMVTIFQYMIGNTDWSVPNYHNIKMIQPRLDSTANPYAVPYDFDFAGIVNASYAFPNPDLFNIEKVTDRLYRGFPRSPEEIEAVLEVFRDNKQKIMDLVNGFELLHLKDRKTMANYIESFYEIINDKKRAKYEFVNGRRD